MFAQNIPNPNQRFVSEGGYITVPWHQFLLNLGAYAGGVVTFPGSGITITNIVNAQQIALSEIATGKVLGNISGVDAIPAAIDFTFLNLTDTPNSYAGNAGKAVIVNPGETALIFSAGGVGTVTSVALSMPAMFSVAGSPITTAGTFTVTLANQTANTVFAGPASGAPAAPTFRVLTLASADFAGQGTATTVLHGNAAGNPSWGAVIEADQSLSDLTTWDVSTTRHGYAPKAPNVASQYLDGTGNWSTPSIGNNYVPMSDGAEPPSIVSDGAGQFSFVPYSPP